MKNQLLLEAVEKYDAPLYVYDADIIEAQFNRISKAFTAVPKVKFNYAVKALSNITILKFIKKMGGNLDTVSIQEIRLGLAAGFLPEEIMYTPNGVSIEEIEEAVKLGVLINIDNLMILEEFGTRLPHVPVCVRINPHVMAGGNKNISVGHIDSKFGISIHQITHIHKIVSNTNLKVNGIHMHTGSDILDIEVFLMASEILFNSAKGFPDLEFIDFGSGFKVPYYNGDIETNIEEFGTKLSKRFNAFCDEYGKELTLMFEPGKFLVSQAGYFLARTNSIKQTTSTVFACLDTGMNHLIRPMMYNAHHDIINISKPEGVKRYYSVVGYICETDTFASNMLINEVSVGDVLAFKNAGAYCFSMSSNYNSRYRPAEVMIYKGELLLIRKRETYEDITHNQVIHNLEELEVI